MLNRYNNININTKGKEKEICYSVKSREIFLFITDCFCYEIKNPDKNRNYFIKITLLSSPFLIELKKNNSMKRLLAGLYRIKEKPDPGLEAGIGTVSALTPGSSIPAIKTFPEKIMDGHQAKISDLLICTEYTCQHINPLSCGCEELRTELWQENPARIKHPAGFQRGENDRLEARRVTACAVHFQDISRLFSIQEKYLTDLKQPVSGQEIPICNKSRCPGQLMYRRCFMNGMACAGKSGSMKSLIESPAVAVVETDAKIQKLPDRNGTLEYQRELLSSIKGVDEKPAVKMIAETNVFRDFDNARKVCCHTGVMTFKYGFGSSTRLCSKVSQMTGKSIKTLLHTADLIATGKLRDYCAKKNKMSVLNAVRDRLIITGLLYQYF
jgi:hypothetical protein